MEFWLGEGIVVGFWKKDKILRDKNEGKRMLKTNVLSKGLAVGLFYVCGYGSLIIGYLEVFIYGYYGERLRLGG